MRTLRSLLLALAVCAAPLGIASIPRHAHAQDAARVARAQELFTQGIAAYEAGRLDEAVRLLREADAIVHSPELTFNIARVYERMGEAREAVRFFERYLREARPTGEERADLDRRIAAMRELDRRMRDQVMTVPPTGDEMTQEARTFFERGVAMFRRRRYDAALQAFTAAYNFARLPEVIYNLAVASERTGHTQDAIDYYREYLRARPDGPDRAYVERRVTQLREEARRQR
ncbi:MAG: tetratricopeptide repeat protein [Myxococcota bacterium]|nr:tetratricopeptide repeat protein [Myxococcota bacterium]